MLQQLVIQFSFYYLSSGRSREVKNKRKFQTFTSKSGKNKRKFQTFTSKSGRDRLREMVAYKRFQIK